MTRGRQQLWVFPVSVPSSITFLTMFNFPVKMFPMPLGHNTPDHCQPPLATNTTRKGPWIVSHVFNFSSYYIIFSSLVYMALINPTNVRGCCCPSLAATQKGCGFLSIFSFSSLHSLSFTFFNFLVKLFDWNESSFAEIISSKFCHSVRC